MKHSSVNTVRSAGETRTREQAHVRIILLVLAVFFLGLAVGAFWHYRATGDRTANTSGGAEGQQPWALSDSTKAVLRRLDSAIEIRFYSLLDPASVPAALREFAGRVDQLLSEYQQEANGRIKVTRYNSPSDAAANAASADGLKPFNLDKGDACYLGIVVSQNEQKESLAQLSPEWEQALESDLTRAIIRINNAKRPAPASVARSAPDPLVIEEVKRLIPDLTSVSMEEGTRILREKALTEFAAATQAMEEQVKQAEQRFLQAQSDPSEAAQQAARKELQEIRTQQTEKLKQIASRLHDQIAALEQLKKP